MSKVTTSDRLNGVLDTERANHERIKYKLRMKGTSLAKISRLLKVSKACLTMVSMGQQRSRLIEEQIANALDEELHETFPDRYPSPKTPQRN